MNTMQQSDPKSRYVLDNAAPMSADRMKHLSRAFDAGTIRHLTELGIGAGWSCLEVGGGGGSIADWLVERVGMSGKVLATDIDPRHLAPAGRPNLEVIRHDIVSDPLPTSAFDLIHARLVLLHIPEREAVLQRLVAALKPGGWLISEDFDYSVVPDSARSPDEVLLPTHRAMLELMDRRGIDRDFGRKLFGRFRARGLVEIGGEGRTFMWAAGSPGPALMRLNYEQLRPDLIKTGLLTDTQWQRDLAFLESPHFLMPSPILWAVWGRKPAA